MCLPLRYHDHRLRNGFAAHRPFPLGPLLLIVVSFCIPASEGPMLSTPFWLHTPHTSFPVDPLSCFFGESALGRIFFIAHLVPLQYRNICHFTLVHQCPALSTPCFSSRIRYYTSCMLAVFPTVSGSLPWLVHAIDPPLAVVIPSDGFLFCFFRSLPVFWKYLRFRGLALTCASMFQTGNHNFWRACSWLNSVATLAGIVPVLSSPVKESPG